jgi:apolipoprotein N-acyltransferase
MQPNIRGELDAPYAFRSDMTMFTRWGDWLPWLCVLIALVLMFMAVRGTRARKIS